MSGDRDELERGRSGRERAALRILGIDPGSAVTGFGLVDRVGARLRHVAHGTIRAPVGSLEGKLAHLFGVVGEVIERHRPDVASVEQVFVSASPRSALVLGQARGAALVALGRAGVTVHEYAPASIKLAVAGSGRAAKGQIQRMVQRLLALDRAPAQDAADALAAAICHASAGRIGALDAPAPRRRSRPGALRVRRAP